MCSPCFFPLTYLTTTTEVDLSLSGSRNVRLTIRPTMLYKITTGQACTRRPDLKLQSASGRRSHHSLQYQRFTELPHRLQKQHLLPRTVRDWNEPPPPPPPHPPDYSSVPHPWHLQVEGVNDAPPSKSQNSSLSLFFFLLSLFSSYFLSLVFIYGTTYL